MIYEVFHIRRDVPYIPRIPLKVIVQKSLVNYLFAWNWNIEEEMLRNKRAGKLGRYNETLRDVLVRLSMYWGNKYPRFIFRFSFFAPPFNYFQLVLLKKRSLGDSIFFAPVAIPSLEIFFLFFLTNSISEIVNYTLDEYQQY